MDTETTTPYVPFLSRVPAKDPMIWVFDSRDFTPIDMTPTFKRLFDSVDTQALERTLSVCIHLDAAREVTASGVSDTKVEWVKLGGEWLKLTFNKCHMGGTRVLEFIQNVTDLDPRAAWVKRINLATHRLELDSGESISFNEFVVLHMLIKGMSHKRIAQQLSISPRTVDYRISRLKQALGVETSEQMMLEVATSGLIQLAASALTNDQPAKNEVELYKSIAD